MGSLTAGWDGRTTERIPEDLRDAPEGDSEKPKGYFEKLEERRVERRISTERRPALGDALPEQSFKQICPQGAPTLPQGQNLYRKSMPELQRTSRSSASSFGRSSVTARYVPTDWGSELKSISHGGQAKKTELSPGFKQSGSDNHSSSWWRHLDSGRNLFESAASAREVEEDQATRKKGSSFIPQFLTKKHPFS